MLCRLALTKVAQDFSWILSDARREKVSWTDKEIASVSDYLASSIPTTIDSRRVDKVFGPEKLVDSFTKALESNRREQGEQVEAKDFFRGVVLSATAVTLPPPSPTYSQHRVSLVTNDIEVEEVVPLYIEFTRGGPETATREQARERMREAHRWKGLWRCYINGEIAGFIVVGRFTPRTASIKNVFVHPDHRRQGVGETMVRAVTRYYLGVQPLGFLGAPEEGPEGGARQEVCLNVIEEGAQRLYGRCGFVLPSESGKGEGEKWYRSSFRGLCLPDLQK